MVLGGTEVARYSLAIFLILTLNFIIPRSMPGDPTLLLFGEDAAMHPEILEELKKEFGLEKPLFEQYVLYLKNLVHGNLGFSFSFQRPVSDVVIEYLFRTLLLTIPATLFGVIFGFFAGTLIAWRESKYAVYVASIVYSAPSYWVAMLFLYFFSYKLGLLPLGGAVSSFEDLNKLLLPSLVIFLHVASVNALMGRAIVAGVLKENFVVTAISKGLEDAVVLRRHLLKPSAAPLIALAAIEFGFAFSGSMLVEIVFSYSGLGMLAWEAVRLRDYPLIQAIFVFVSLIVVSMNAFADLLSKALDPRLRK